MSKNPGRTPQQLSLPMKPQRKKNKYSAKRRQVLGFYRRWILWSLVVCLAISALSLLFVSAYRALLISPLLEVTRINVSGSQRLDPQVLIQHAGIPSGANILSLDLKAIHRRITTHPGVLAAVITREIPDRILIEIEERQPLALVRAHDFYLMDIEGVCFARAAPAE